MVESYKLPESIIAMSEADNWDEAKLEWSLSYIEYAEDSEVAEGAYSCLCGKEHLRELCYIVNKYNGKKALVGNKCIKKFMEHIEDMDSVFYAIKNKKLNKDIIEYARKRDIITEKQYAFLCKWSRKRNLDENTEIVCELLMEKIISRCVI
jgi:hypothetical protein